MNYLYVEKGAVQSIYCKTSNLRKTLWEIEVCFSKYYPKQYRKKICCKFERGNFDEIFYNV